MARYLVQASYSSGAMAAVSMAVGASGTAKEIKTTVLLLMEEEMKKAASVGYKVPGS